MCGISQSVQINLSWHKINLMNRATFPGIKEKNQEKNQQMCMYVYVDNLFFVKILI